MKILLKVLLLIATFFLTTTALADRGERVMRQLVTGIGSGSDADRGSAESQAYEQAQTNANMYCSMGMIEDGTYEKTADSCITQGNSNDPSGVTYICMVTVRATCVVHY